ncbi:MAG: TonB-dependent receptor plug domain-containing protein [Rhodanobacteraceae bacterium]
MNAHGFHAAPDPGLAAHRQGHPTLRRKTLAIALSSVLASAGVGLGLVPLPAQATSDAAAGAQQNTSGAQAATPDTADQKDKTKTLQTVEVTGSLIPVSQVETAVPVIRLNAEDLQKQGYTSVYEALRAQPLATGPVVDSQTAPWGYTPGAATISLLGLNPDFTLFLIDGHPVTTYPLLYRGGQNVVDVTHLPLSMIERIDIVPGNFSSIYGSSAIAGVINIVLKKHVTGYELTAEGGYYSRGGGASEKLSLVGGYNKGKFDLVYGVQFNHQNPIYKWTRPNYAFTTANPKPDLRVGYPTFLDEYLAPSGYSVYEDPGSACDGVSGLYTGTTKRYAQPGYGLPLDEDGIPTGPGYYCGSPNYWAYATLLNRVKGASGYLNATYDINQNVELYGSLLYNVSSDWVMTGLTYWESNLDGGGYFWNGSKNRFETLIHEFAPEEWGDPNAIGESFLGRSYTGWGGARGALGSSNFDYDVYYTRSEEKLYVNAAHLVTDKVNDFFQKNVLGPEMGTTSGYPIYDPNMANFYKAVTPAEYAGMIEPMRDRAETWIQSLNARVTNGSLFELPGGDAGFAAVFQYGSQSWSTPENPLEAAGHYYGVTASGGGGTRSFMAAGAEIRAPVLSWLTLDASGRFDKFKNDGGGGESHRATYRLGIEVRPIETLLFRGSLATAFRAPDMAYVFGGESSSHPQQLTDYYRCDLYGGSLGECPYFANQTLLSVSRGNLDLKPITAKSLTLGVVWSPTRNFSIKADYYRIKIRDEVELSSEDTELRQEAACRTGALDPGSSTCQAVLGIIQRAPVDSPLNGAVTKIFVEPFNVANEEVEGVSASMDFSHDFGRFGNLALNLSYNDTLKHTFQASAGDPVVHTLREPQLPPSNLTFKSIASATATWELGKWSVVLHETRYGSTPNYAAWFDGFGGDVDPYFGAPAGKVRPWILYNGSVTYNVSNDLRLSLIVNNIRNSRPPYDRTWVDDPLYNWEDYNIFGRSVALQLNWRFGQ